MAYKNPNSQHTRPRNLQDIVKPQPKSKPDHNTRYTFCKILYKTLWRTDWMYTYGMVGPKKVSECIIAKEKAQLFHAFLSANKYLIYESNHKINRPLYKRVSEQYIETKNRSYYKYALPKRESTFPLAKLSS